MAPTSGATKMAACAVEVRAWLLRPWQHALPTDGMGVAEDQRPPLPAPNAMPLLAALRRTLYELLSARFIELQKSARASRIEQRIGR
ncbi:MAG TPA: hypothetical protein VNE00_19120 [Paraburkholderia sp.]|jgi:hypothetical protein|nr:hypothetical protein [Paraburkholderia sp.]